MTAVSASRKVSCEPAQAEVPDDMTNNLRDILALHFHPEKGTPYWLGRQRQLGIDVVHEVRGIGDLWKLGPMDDQSLRGLPVEEFVPRTFLSRKHRLIIGDSAGSLGSPKIAAFSEEDFRRAFVEPFVRAARAMRFPRRENWLFVGPSGPHIIGKAARACAGRLKSMDPFAVDFDPRWAKKMKPGSMGQRRYLEHVIEQALEVMHMQDIGVLFATPAVLTVLGERMSEVQRMRIKGVHYGGLALTGELYEKFRRDIFPKAVHLSGYGNSLFGMCPELFSVEPRPIDYYPQGSRLVIRLIPMNDVSDQERMRQKVAYGERGQIMFHRLDQSGLIVNMCERDSAERIPPPSGLEYPGFRQDGFRSPESLPDIRKQLKTGLY
jgi:thienamycin biosynthesis protein ThnN